MKKFRFLIASFVLGSVFSWFLLAYTMSYQRRNPVNYAEAAEQALAASGIKGTSADHLSLALNPCRLAPEISDVCKEYNKRGVPPPIQIVLDFPRISAEIEAIKELPEIK